MSVHKLTYQIPAWTSPHPHRHLIDAAVDSRASDTMLWSGKLLDVTEILILYLIIGAF